MSDEKTQKSITYALKAPVIMTFPKLFTAERFKRNGKETAAAPVFSATFLLVPDSEDLLALKKIATEIAKQNTQAALSTLRFPFANGDRKADERKEKVGKDDAAFNRGKVILAASTGEKYPPRLGVFPSGNPKDGALDLGTDEVLVKKYTSWFYSGANVLAVVSLKWYPAANEEAKAGVKAYLSAVVSTGKGDHLASGGSVTSHFGAYTGHATAEDPTKGLAAAGDDEIPF